MAPNEPDPLLTATESARVLRIPVKRLRRAIRAGELPAYRIGAWWRVRAADLQNWIDSKRVARGAGDRDALVRVLGLIEVGLAALGGLEGDVRDVQRPFSAALDVIHAAIDRAAP